MVDKVNHPPGLYLSNASRNRWERGWFGKASLQTIIPRSSLTDDMSSNPYFSPSPKIQPKQARHTFLFVGLDVGLKKMMP